MTPQEQYTPLFLTGSPRARGRAHGEALRTLIRALFEAWAEEIGREAGLGLRPYMERFLAETAYLPAIQRWTPDLLMEVEGVAEGAGVRFEECLCLQFMDQHWHHLQGVQSRGGCSTLGGLLPRGGGALIGQNMDLPPFLDGFQVLLQINYPEEGLELLIPSFAGLIGLFGINNRGLGLCVNTISQLNTDPGGLPVAFLIRRLLEQGSVDQAASLLERLPHAAGQNYLIAGSRAVVSLECSARAVSTVPSASGSWLCHTNHPLASSDIREEKIGWDSDRAAADVDHGLTFSRQAALERGLDLDPPTTVARAKELLAAVAHPKGRFPDVFTFCSVIFRLGPQQAVHLALGPRGTAYQQFELA